MSLAFFLSLWLSLQLLILFSCGFFLLLSVLVPGLDYRSRLKLNSFALLLVFALPLLQNCFPAERAFESPAKIWSAAGADGAPAVLENKAVFALARSQWRIDTESAGDSWGLAALLLLLLATARLGLDLRALGRLKRNGFLIRRSGKVSVYGSESVLVPFSLWIPGRAYVLMPVSMLEDAGAFRIALAHELQHHRQGDTRLIYLCWILRLISFPNPAAHFWARKISELQEFACDEALLGRSGVDPRAYARCLLEVAETAQNRKGNPACATGLSFPAERQLIKRRILEMLQPRTKRKSGPLTAALCAILTAAAATTAFAARELVQDRRVSPAQAEKMAATASRESSFPIVVNDLVLDQLNRFLGTPGGREYMRLSLQRMENYRPMVSAKLSQYGLPMELMAVPIIESGYRNLEERNQAGWGAGLWMFIKSTARNYGLKVNESVDERLSEEILTDAAIRYLRANHLRFRDWNLAALAYNMGENSVQKAINSTGSRDAWELIRQGHENDRNYLPKLMAAILIMKNPESVK